MTNSPRVEQAEIRAAQRDRTVFPPLYERYADAVYGYCLRRGFDLAPSYASGFTTRPR